MHALRSIDHHAPERRGGKAGDGAANGDASERLYSKNIASVEPTGNEAMPADVKGIDAIRKKHEWWTERCIRRM